MMVREMLLSLMAIGALAMLEGCGPSNTDFPVGNDNAKQSKNPYVDVAEAKGSIFGGNGIAVAFSPGRLFGGDQDAGEVPPGGPQIVAAAPNSIRVNGFLWSAALDTLSFMPIENADPAGGIIQTGWFSDPDFIEERFRVNVFILSGDLREDAVAVGVFYENRDGAANWLPSHGEEGAAEQIEGLIVERARELQTNDRSASARSSDPYPPRRSAVRDDHAVAGALPKPASHPPYTGEDMSGRF